MSADRKPLLPCAIYTRKSSEEGLEQSFNSLHAQREASLAYIVSQRHEGWRVVDTQYDDGGYSGATMDRPAVKRLLEDIKDGKIDVVVVYKVDRLTRSLADFAKTIDVFDANHVSFVSVTQQFNTTSSMGRLTLNVLLSFAQFEREVAGERIRDKIAASKRKGMWMGGMVPLGYDLKDHKLMVNSAEAKRVLEIYRAYLKLGCVTKLKARLDRAGVKSKTRVSRAGRKSGGGAYSRGSLYELLANRIYLGETTHREQSYPGQHKAIVPRELWDRVQARLRANNDARRNGVDARSPSLLAGLIQDERGNRFTPSHALKDGKRYRYYVSQAAIHHRVGPTQAPTRMPAGEVERLVLSKLQSFLASEQALVDALGLARDSAATTQALVAAAQKTTKTLRAATTVQLRQFVQAVVVGVAVREASIELTLNKRAMREALLETAPKDRASTSRTSDSKIRDEFIILELEARVKRCGGEVRLVLEGTGEGQPTRAVPSMIKAVARAREWYEGIGRADYCGRRSIGKRTGIDERYVSLIIRCAFLAPDIIETILDGRQPVALTLAKITSRLPMDWAEQRRQLGFTSCRDGSTEIVARRNVALRMSNLPEQDPLLGLGRRLRRQKPGSAL